MTESVLHTLLFLNYYALFYDANLYYAALALLFFVLLQYSQSAFQSAFEETFIIRLLLFLFFLLDEPFHFHAVFSRNQGHVNHSTTATTTRLNIIIAVVLFFLLFVFSLFLLFSSSFAGLGGGMEAKEILA